VFLSETHVVNTMSANGVVTMKITGQHSVNGSCFLKLHMG